MTVLTQPGSLAVVKLGEEVLPGDSDDPSLFPPQDYRWWWRNFLVSGGSAFYVLVYAIFYFVNKVLPCMKEPPNPFRAGLGREGCWGEPQVS